MDKIILGILMLHRMTAYELRNFIKNNFKSMYSDSLGSIQAALKKLFELEMVTFVELVEKGVNKKRYSITETGREALIEWIKIPINTSKTKNYDLGKLFFMGYVSKKDQKTLIDKIIISDEVGVNKPDKRIFEYAMNYFEIMDKSEVIMIGDSLGADIKGGQNAGIDTCWVNLRNNVNDTGIVPKYEVRKLEELFEIL